MDKRLVSDLTVDEFVTMAKDIPRTFFKEAVNEVYWENTKHLGIAMTGKDLTNPRDLRCIHSTFENSQKCRLNKEENTGIMKTAIMQEGVKILLSVGITIAGVWAYLKKNGLM